MSRRNRDEVNKTFNDNQYRAQRAAAKHISTERLKDMKPESDEGKRAVREELESRGDG